ncbi:MAG: hypothetical protein H6706_13470 [Myxococcales bacterium]|nr:hypothetical protein [Myxococcales bacterium]
MSTRPWISADAALAERLAAAGQLDATAPESALPPYLESFLAHLRLLVGVPFQYLVPDARLLPDESIRFFYLDRSWTDRLVDGAMAVGQIGSREQAHYHAQAAPVRDTLDRTERAVRGLQRRVSGFGIKPALPGAAAAPGASAFDALKTGADHGPGAGTVTGFLLRSALVSGWPHLDVRAYRQTLPPDFDPADPATKALQLRTLRLERLSPAVLLVLFEGVPQLVVLEEPHHGVQFGVRRGAGDQPQIWLRRANGRLMRNPDDSLVAPVPVPMRPGGKNVVDVRALRAALDARKTAPAPGGEHVPPQTGGGSFALGVLSPPYRQRFEGTVDEANAPPPVRPGLALRPWLADDILRARVARLREDD